MPLTLNVDAGKKKKRTLKETLDFNLPNLFTVTNEGTETHMGLQVRLFYN